MKLKENSDGRKHNRIGSLKIDTNLIDQLATSSLPMVIDPTNLKSYNTTDLDILRALSISNTLHLSQPKIQLI